jgi:antitoxin component of MazEF toxin-antitoxin module
MKTIVLKLENNREIEIPEILLKDIHLAKNDLFYVTLDNEKIIIKEINVKKHKTTKERLIEFYGQDYEKYSVSQEEVDWGKPVGEEIW